VHDLDAAAERMRKACYQSDGVRNEGPKKYTFFLLDKQMGGGGHFYWYRTKRGLTEALKHDLVGFIFTSEGSDSKEVDELLARICKVIDAASKDELLSEDLRAKIDRLLIEPWHGPFIGTYESLLKAKGAWQLQLRGRFRQESDIAADDSNTKPISKAELEAFSKFVSQPFE